MVIWRGWGWLALVVILLVVGWSTAVFPAIWMAFSGYDGAYNGERGVGWGIGWILGAVLLFLFNAFVLLKLERVPSSGEALQARVEAKKAAEARGETYVVPQHTKPYSSFFFIPLRWLVLVFLAIGVVMLVINVPAAIQDLADHAAFEENMEQLRNG